MDAVERRAILTLLALALAGHGARLALGSRGDHPGSLSLLPPADSGSLQAQRDRVERLTRPLEAGETIDLDTAPAEELTRLPKIGPSLARAIVSDRSRRGPFGGLAALDRVAGIGPAVLGAVQPFAVFSGTAVPPAPGSGPVPGRLDLNSATADELETLPGIGPQRAARVVAYRELHGPFARVESLSSVPGIGSGLVERVRALVLVR